MLPDDVVYVTGGVYVVGLRPGEWRFRTYHTPLDAPEALPHGATVAAECPLVWREDAPEE